MGLEYGSKWILAGEQMRTAELIESADEDGFTPLHLAIIQGNLQLVNLLLANGADLIALDNEGHSVVHRTTGKVPSKGVARMYNR